MSLEIKRFEAKLNELKPTSNNPRQINKEDFEVLKKSLREFPEMREIREVVVDENMTILGGHQRVKALEAIGEHVVPVKQVIGLTEEQKKEFIIKDNIANGEWDMDELANSWSDIPLNDWGLEVDWTEFEDVIDEASENTVKEYEEDTNYNLDKLVREAINPDISKKITEAKKSGKIRKEILDIVEARAKQCTIFNFDEIIKYYRSGDATEEEKELLRRLYLVFITPREAFETGQLKITTISGNIYDDELLAKEGGYDDER